jgi:hypothetical protein
MTTIRSSSLLLLTVAVLLGCEENSRLPSPLVRVDLRAKLPPQLQRRISVADTSYECRKTFTLSSEGASQRFVASWRVLADGGSKYVTAVQIEPDGSTSGVTAPSASARVQEMVLRDLGPGRVAAVPVRVTWTAAKGCSKVSATTQVELAANDPGCTPPRTQLKLLTPVK